MPAGGSAAAAAHRAPSVATLAPAGGSVTLRRRCGAPSWCARSVPLLPAGWTSRRRTGREIPVTVHRLVPVRRTAARKAACQKFPDDAPVPSTAEPCTTRARMRSLVPKRVGACTLSDFDDFRLFFSLLPDDASPGSKRIDGNAHRVIHNPAPAALRGGGVAPSAPLGAIGMATGRHRVALASGRNKCVACMRPEIPPRGAARRKRSGVAK